MRDALIVLGYHAVSLEWECPLSVTPAQLTSQLTTLVERGYRSAPFGAILDPPPGKTVVVTFDDAFKSVIELAYPALSAAGLQGTVFVPTKFVGQNEPMSWDGIEQWIGTADAKELQPMSWEDVRLLAEAGWEVGSHSHTHPHLTRLDDTELAAELRQSREDCERQVGRACDTIAYPYGEVDGRVARAATEAGYRAGAMLGRRLSARPMTWPRIGIYRCDSRLRFLTKLSRPARSPAGMAAAALLAGGDRVRRAAQTR